VSHKQLAVSAWGEICRISPHEKKEKILVGQNSTPARTVAGLFDAGPDEWSIGDQPPGSA
jgi:hypothetical protein